MCNKQNEVETSNHNILNLFDLLSTIQQKNHALRALGALLSTADLSDFFNTNLLQDSQGKEDAENRQFGIGDLINLCLDDQEQVLESVADEYGESDAWKIERASDLIQVTKEGAFTGHIPTDHFFKTLNNLKTIIARNSIYKPLAETLKDSLMKYAPPQALEDLRKEEA